MEIEAKFALADRAALQRLQTLACLGGFSLLPARVRQVRDTYLDTADRRILAAGYSCRRREQSEGILVTLKALTRPADAVHRRQEWQALLAADMPPAAWPAGPLRDQVLQLIGEAPLAPWIELSQVRHVRPVMRDEQAVAELSLDEVRLAAADTEQAYFELEVELLDEGSAEDLAAIMGCLRTEWGLRAEPRSKFERALALLH